MSKFVGCRFFQQRIEEERLHDIVRLPECQPILTLSNDTGDNIIDALITMTNNALNHLVGTENEEIITFAQTNVQPLSPQPRFESVPKHLMATKSNQELEDDVERFIMGAQQQEEEEEGQEEEEEAPESPPSPTFDSPPAHPTLNDIAPPPPVSSLARKSRRTLFHQ
eukprot:TRINITY_DN2854_c0_g2_i1.p1 TRINITY_DN2854_c0_g2~~TRINITY_DN2854_c0_g2_i1.p1  ORF type:complete len:167 (+),score=45.53 TRINITY_DN2854_c0_g2_i1:86-586(+)